MANQRKEHNDLKCIQRWR